MTRAELIAQASILEWNKELAEARAQVAELERDAERYRWMELNWAYADDTIFFDGFNLGPRTTLGAAIDERIAAQGKEPNAELSGGGLPPSA